MLDGVTGLGALNDIRNLPAVAIVPPGAEWPRECNLILLKCFHLLYHFPSDFSDLLLSF